MIQAELGKTILKSGEQREEGGGQEMPPDIHQSLDYTTTGTKNQL